MHIHEIIIDGFKSYATRTVVSGFDPHFNAITGLNGSGKSNILDSICFVLGISNLSQVRVGNLQELVYKQGQAGVTKASVTIVFNNADPAGSPVGYEQHKQITVTRQVVIGGKNKYMINGITCQQSQVQNLFHSVQLNVNNPHFLIMQGRITKVLNMKPQEILSMIEEAAGTRMFETKKQAALKTIEKKQLKVDEITRVMDADITPTLDKLKGDKQTYQTWSHNNTEVEKLERFCTAHAYTQAEEQVQNSSEQKLKMEGDLQALDDLEKAHQAKIDDCQQRADELTQQLEAEQTGELKELERIEQEISKELVKVDSLWKNQKESITTEKESLVTLTKQVESTEKSLEEKKAELNECTTAVAGKDAEATKLDRAMVELREKYQNACAGVADETTAELVSLPEQVGIWEKRAREALSQLQQGELRVSHSKEAIKELKKTVKNQQSTHTQVLKEAETLKAKVAEMERNISSLSFNEEEESNLRTRQGELRKSVSVMRDTVEKLGAQLEARLAFEYRDPEKGFDRSRVKGMVARLVRVNNPAAATALEIAAGSKLYQVVVDTESTGKLILQKGALKKRVTILPLNVINNRCTDPAKVQRAKQIASAAGGQANLALELIGCEEEVRRAMEHVFGSTIICDSPDSARAIAFDPKIRNRTVTLDGDSFDPSGTLTGGSKNNLGELLAKLERLSAATEEFEAMKSELAQVDAALKRIEGDGQRFRDMTSDLEIRRHALQMCEQKMAGTSYAQTMAEIDKLEAEMAAHDREAISLKAAHDNAKDELKKLKDAEANIKKQREKAMKDMELKVRSASKAVTEAKAVAAKMKHKRDVVSAEVSTMQKELTTLQEQVSIAKITLQKLNEEVEKLSVQVDEKKERYEAAKAAVGNKQQDLKKCSKEIKALEAAKESTVKALKQVGTDKRKLKHQISEYDTDAKTAVKHLDELLKNNAWISTEKAFFGKAGGNYDYSARDPAEAKSRLSELKSSQEKISKKVNKKVMGMMEKAETEYSELTRKKEVIMNDKSKIEAVIDELDVKKAQSLQSTWVKVNRDFGSIFSTLLPGTHAKLEPLEGCSVMDGLEVKVAFNGVWKESLTELSGGQRSLLALSLILSLLLFKPAPMYILDEVDAALDLSHTQNIGLMLRTHFSASQFIVVSLKEGMFNNANVIFRTRFVDGVSTVGRTVTGGKMKALAQAAAEDEVGDENAAPQKKKGKALSARNRSAAIEA